LGAKYTFRVWDDRDNIQKHVQLAVMLALADFADDEGKCWPAIPTIAAKARTSESTARLHIRKLEARGLIKVDQNAARKGSNLYQLYPTDARWGLTPPALGASPPALGGDPTDARRSTPPTLGAEPTIEPKKEPYAREGEYETSFVKPLVDHGGREPKMPQAHAVYVADCLNGAGHYPIENLPLSDARELVHRKLITKERLRERGIEID
jgi:hypothetical protein